MPGKLYHYIWDFWDPDRWHMAPVDGSSGFEAVLGGLGAF